MTMTAPQSNRSVRIRKVDLRQEQAAGGGNCWYGAYLSGVRALPHPIDDLSRDFGPDIYGQMLLDPQISGDLEVLKGGVLASGPHLSPAVDEKDPRFTLASEIATFCRYNLDTLRESLNDVLYDGLDCVAFGNRIIEQTYRDGEPGEAAQFKSLKGGGLFLSSLKPKPRRNLAFVVDEYLNTVGLLARRPGEAWSNLYPGMVADGTPNLLPREKFLILTWRPRDGDPRGTSHLRACYSAWWNSLQVLGEYLRYLTQFAGPSLIALMEDNASQLLAAIENAAGEFQYETDGTLRTVNPAQATVDVLTSVRNGTAGALFGVKDLKVLGMTGNGEAFLAAFDRWDREKSKAILGNTLSTNEGQHNARAAASVAQDVTGLPVAYGKTVVAEALRDDVLTWLTVYNYGPECKSLTPTVSMSAAEQQDVPAMLQGLSCVGYQVHWSQFEKIDGELGLPERMAKWREDDLANQPKVAKTGSDPNQDPQGDEGDDASG